jgi:hypothetical protein
MLVFALLAGCESVEPSGQPFSPVAPAPVAAPAPADPELAFPTAPPVKITSEQLALGTVAPATAAGVDTEALTAPEPEAAPVVAPAPPPIVSAPMDQWPVRLVSTLPQAQPPRAILGLPSGEERVVSPGMILAEQGLVVMSVSADKVQLAKVSSAGDHAVIEPLELSAAYPAR